MSIEEHDMLVGRVIRESREAEAELQKLLVRADLIATEIGQLAADVRARVQRAKNAGVRRELPGGRMVVSPDAMDAGFEVGHLSAYAKVVDLDAIGALDRAIGIAVAHAIKLRQQCEQLGV